MRPLEGNQKVPSALKRAGGGRGRFTESGRVPSVSHQGRGEAPGAALRAVGAGGEEGACPTRGGSGEVRDASWTPRAEGGGSERQSHDCMKYPGKWRVVLKHGDLGPQNVEGGPSPLLPLSYGNQHQEGP